MSLECPIIPTGSGASFETYDRRLWRIISLTWQHRYGKEVMVCEIGADEADAAGSYELVQAVIDAVRSVPEGKGLSASTGGSRRPIPISCRTDYPLGNDAAGGHQGAKVYQRGQRLLKKLR